MTRYWLCPDRSQRRTHKHPNSSQQQHQLRDQVKRLQDWETEKTRYALQKRGKKYLHELRRESANGEPQHWLCPKCFSEGRKSILQDSTLGCGGV